VVQQSSQNFIGDINDFSKFFHWRAQKRICNKVIPRIVKPPTQYIEICRCQLVNNSIDKIRKRRVLGTDNF